MELGNLIMKKLCLIFSTAYFALLSLSEVSAFDRFALDKVLMTNKCAAQYSTCDLKYADFRGQNRQNGFFARAKMDGLQGQHADFRGADFTYAQLGFANFAGADLRKADFRGANLHHVDFTGANLEGARFTGNENHRTNMYHVDARDADFKNAKMSRVIMNRGDFRGADFKYANLKRTKQHGTNFRGARLKGSEQHQLRRASDALFNPSTKRIHVPAIRAMTHNHQLQKQG